MNSLPLVLLLAASAASGSDFESRVAEAKKAAASPEGQRYAAEAGPTLGSAMASCIPPGTTDPKNLGEFILIGRVTAQGELKDYAVNSTSTVALCFARAVAQSRWPVPPVWNGQLGNFPIEVTMKVVP
jgi:hypothetical protein